MRLTAIKPGDIVEVNDGLPYLAIVRERQPQVLLVRPACGSKFNPRPVKAREVTGHWRRAR